MMTMVVGGLAWINLRTNCLGHGDVMTCNDLQLHTELSLLLANQPQYPE
jgi:hypothetical protein